MGETAWRPEFSSLYSLYRLTVRAICLRARAAAYLIPAEARAMVASPKPRLAAIALGPSDKTDQVVLTFEFSPIPAAAKYSQPVRRQISLAGSRSASLASTAPSAGCETFRTVAIASSVPPSSSGSAPPLSWHGFVPLATRPTVTLLGALDPDRALENDASRWKQAAQAAFGHNRGCLPDYQVTGQAGVTCARAQSRLARSSRLTRHSRCGRGLRPPSAPGPTPSCRQGPLDPAAALC